MLCPLATQHPGEGKTCPPKGPSPHLAVAAALTPLDGPSFRSSAHSHTAQPLLSPWLPAIS